MAKVAFVGDVMIGRGIKDEFLDNDQEIISESIKEIFKRADFSVCNLESPVCIDAQKNRPNSFRSTPVMLSKVDVFDLYSVANNHIFDCGTKGAVETINALGALKLNWIGLNDSNEVNYYSTSIQDLSFLFIAAAVDYCVKNEDGNFPTIQYLEDVNLLEFISDKSQNYDHIICLVHGGNEMVPFPEPTFRSKCKSLIDSGAAIVVTHHPHVLGGHEVYKEKNIFYSLGDFIFDGKSFLRRKGAILIYDFKNNEWELIPTCIDKNLKVDLSKGIEAQNILRRWEQNSKAIRESDYDNKYRLRYIRSLLEFQLDRLYYLFKNEGLVNMLSFMFNKAGFAKHYLLKIKKGQ